jgi:hypothetical protein
MHDWLEQLRDLISGPGSPRARKWLHRRIHLADEVVMWFRAPDRTQDDRTAFAELLLRLDSDPVSNSSPILRPGGPKGVRWAAFGNHRAVFILDAANDRISVLRCC